MWTFRSERDTIFFFTSWWSSVKTFCNIWFMRKINISDCSKYLIKRSFQGTDGIELWDYDEGGENFVWKTFFKVVKEINNWCLMNIDKTFMNIQTWILTRISRREEEIYWNIVQEIFSCDIFHCKYKSKSTINSNFHSLGIKYRKKRKINCP